VAHRAVTGEGLEPGVGEEVVGEAHALLDTQAVAVAGHDPRGLLAAVLQGVEAEIGQPRGLGMAEDPEQAALVVERSSSTQRIKRAPPRA
jgi:hypothetical protein